MGHVFPDTVYVCVIPYFSYCVFQTGSSRSMGAPRTRPNPHQVKLSRKQTMIPSCPNFPHSNAKYLDNKQFYSKTFVYFILYYA